MEYIEMLSLLLQVHYKNFINCKIAMFSVAHYLISIHLVLRIKNK